MRSFLVILSTLLIGLMAGVPRASAQGHEHHHGGEDQGEEMPTFKRGRYVGHLKIEGRPERLAVEADFFIHGSENVVDFPRLWGIFKFGLGGYRTHEYFSQLYQDVKANFDTGELTFDELGADLIITTQVHGTAGRPILHGTIFSRSSAVSGTLHLVFQSDEPEASPSGAASQKGQLPFAPLLQGQYLGKCNGQERVFQVQTVRGLRPFGGDGSRELFEYEIVARLGERNDGKSGATGVPWIVIGNFAGGLYDPFRGRFLFSGPSTTGIECDRNYKTLNCRYRIRGVSVSCQFQRTGNDVQGMQFSERSYHLSPSAGELEELPTEDVRDGADLMKFLGGAFQGNLHHEIDNTYQPVVLTVVPTKSTENPHNQNKIFVSTTAVVYYGRSISDQYITQRYQPRSFYIRPGFALSAAASDSFIIVEEWKKGFIRGVWYSRNFGRVGTVELLKGKSAAAQIPTSLGILPPWHGEFEGIKKVGGDIFKRWFYIIYSNVSGGFVDATVPFMGSYQPDARISKIEAMERGRFDPYTGALGWTFAANGGISIVNGHVLHDGRLALHWPPAPGNFSAWMSDLEFLPFGSVGGANQ